MNVGTLTTQEFSQAETAQHSILSFRGTGKSILRLRILPSFRLDPKIRDKNLPSKGRK